MSSARSRLKNVVAEFFRYREVRISPHCAAAGGWYTVESCFV
jgi:hypothetical protein